METSDTKTNYIRQRITTGLTQKRKITEFDLLKLRYRVITRLKDAENTVEFIHQDFEDREYMVKLRNGEIQIVFPLIKSITAQPCFRTENLEELIAWHYHY